MAGAIRKAIGLGVCIGLAVPACGDDGGSRAISKAEYLGRASRVCREGNEALTKASNEVFAAVPPGRKPSPAEIEEFVRTTVVPTLRDQIGRLRAIPPPKGRQGQVDQIYDALDDGLGELRGNPGKLADGSNVFAEAEALAKKYGLPVCATTG